MLCELCKKDEAAGVLHRKSEDGEDEELYVCKKCLKANNHDGDTSDSGRETSDAPRDDEPPAFIKNFLDAAVGLIEGVTGGAMPKEKKCSQCGATWEKIKDEETVSCPDCWAQFGKEIYAKYLGGSYGPRHLGMIPQKTPDGKPSKAFLEKELKDAVARQNYRKAAHIRKLLDELGGDECGDAQNGGGR